MTVVVDAALVVAALIDTGPDGSWAERQLGRTDLAAPHLMPVEAANIMRRKEIAGEISADVAALAHGDLLDLPVALHPYDLFGSRVWQLRQSVTCYDAWYVALAEELGSPLATLDRRLARSSGPRCKFLLPPTDR